jgi:hypothetical protein
MNKHVRKPVKQEKSFDQMVGALDKIIKGSQPLGDNARLAVEGFCEAAAICARHSRYDMAAVAIAQSSYYSIPERDDLPEAHETSVPKVSAYIEESAQNAMRVANLIFKAGAFTDGENAIHILNAFSEFAVNHVSDRTRRALVSEWRRYQDFMLRDAGNMAKVRLTADHAMEMGMAEAGDQTLYAAARKLERKIKQRRSNRMSARTLERLSSHSRLRMH